MSRMVSAQLEGKRLERYEDAEEEEGMGNKSEFLRSLLGEGLDAREQTTYQAAGLSDRLAAQLEDEREFYDDEEDILREVVEDGLSARRGDALDAIGADEELRDLVEDAREENEPLDDTVRRLIRDGADRGRTDGRQPSAVIPATLTATLAGSVILLATGEGGVGVPLAIASAFGVAGWGLARLTGWGAWVADKIAVLREGFQDIGGVSGFFRVTWRRYKDDHPIDEPSTAVERAARLDNYLPAFFVVAVAVGLVMWGVVEAGLLPLIGPTGALILLLAFILAVYAIPAAMVVAAAAQLAVAGVGRASDADTAEQDERKV